MTRDERQSEAFRRIRAATAVARLLEGAASCGWKVEEADATGAAAAIQHHLGEAVRHLASQASGS